MNNEELAEVLRQHAAWLADPATGAKADLSGANLSGAHLSGAHLSGADLSGANLSGAHLSGADLRWSNLSRSDLSKADLSDANLRRANLSEANLVGANFSRANLRGTNLRGADLRGAQLNNSHWAEAKTDFPVFTFCLGRHQAVAVRDSLSVGCETHSWDVWLTDWQRLGEAAGYLPTELERYGRLISVFHKEITCDIC